MVWCGIQCTNWNSDRSCIFTTRDLAEWFTHTPSHTTSNRTILAIWKMPSCKCHSYLWNTVQTGKKVARKEILRTVYFGKGFRIVFNRRFPKCKSTKKHRFYIWGAKEWMYMGFTGGIRIIDLSVLSCSFSFSWILSSFIFRVQVHNVVWKRESSVHNLSRK